MINQYLVSKILSTIKEERDALTVTAEFLSIQQLDDILNVLTTNTGTLFILGVGKSAAIAKKAAATFNSIGYPTFYIHPTDAGHGDMGAIRSTDIVLLISKSGESEELIQILPHLHSRSKSVMLLTACPESTLAKSINAKLFLPKLREACPHNLAPTVSTTITLAVLDGIAMAIMSSFNVSPADFATNHPAGQLGRRLTVTLADIMHRESENPIASPQTPILEIVQILSEYALGAVNIIDQEKNLLGLITDGDVRRAIRRFSNAGLMNLSNITADLLMTRNPTSASKNCLAYDAFMLMKNRERPLSVIPVLENESQKCIGLVRLHDLIKSGVV